MNTMIIPITDLRRRFGEVTKNLSSYEKIILTKGGRPFAELRASGEVRKRSLEKAKGAWKGTSLDDDNLWREVFKKKSRKASVVL